MFYDQELTKSSKLGQRIKLYITKILPDKFQERLDKKKNLSKSNLSLRLY